MFGGEPRSCCVMMHLEKLQCFFGERNVVHSKDALINHGSHQPALFFSYIYTFGMRNTLLYCEFLLEMNIVSLYLSYKQLREFRCCIASFCFLNFENSRKKLLKMTCLILFECLAAIYCSDAKPFSPQLTYRAKYCGWCPSRKTMCSYPGIDRSWTLGLYHLHDVYSESLCTPLIYQNPQCVTLYYNSTKGRLKNKQPKKRKAALIPRLWNSVREIMLCKHFREKEIVIWYNCIFNLNSQTSHSAMGGSDMVNWWWWWCSGWPTVSPHSKTVVALIPAPWVSLCADVVWGARQANGEPEVIHKWPTFVSVQRHEKPSSHGQRELEYRRGGW